MSERFSWSPAPNPVETTNARVRSARFGDGYSQRVPDGINSMVRTWELSFTRQTADINAIAEFLRARAGVESFDWQPPAGQDGKWLCASWPRTVPAMNVQTINVTFEEVFGD